MRVAVATSVLACALGASAPARAQFPFLGLETTKGPEVRIAGRDPLRDDVERFMGGVEADLTAAEADLHSLEAEQDMLARRSPEQSALIFFARQRVQHLSAAKVAAQRARQVLAQPARPSAPPGLERLTTLRLSAARYQAAKREAEIAAQRLEASATPVAGAPITARAAAERGAQAARARAARARVFEAAAKARRALDTAQQGQRELVIAPGAGEAARGRVIELEARLAALEASPLPEHEAIVTATTSSSAAGRLQAATLALDAARGELRTRRIRAAEAALLAARALEWGYDTLDGGRPRLRPAALLPKDLQAHYVGLEDERGHRAGQLAEIRQGLAAPDIHEALATSLAARAAVLDQILLELAREEDAVSQALATVEVVQGVMRMQRRRPLWQAGLLIALVVLLAFISLRFGGRYGARLLAPKVPPLGLTERQSGRALALASLLWPLVVVAGAAALVIWPVLRLEITVLEALQVVNRPLFYVEDTGVSPLSIVQFVLTIWVAVVVSRWLRSFFTERVYARTGWDIGLTNALDTLVHYVVLLVGMVLGLRFVGVGFSSLAILAGVLGIGIGFGLRNITENFISGLIILAERPIKIGDFIEVKDGSVEGRVDSIRARSTTVTTRDNISMIIPNSEFVGRPVVNWSHGDPKVRVSIPVGVAYGSDTDLVRKVLLEVAKRHGKVLKKPAPEVQFSAFGGSSLDFLLLVWIDEQQVRFRIASDLHFAVDKAFRKHNIEIAFPQLDLHLKTIQASVAAAFAPPMPALEDPPLPKPKLPETRKERARAVRTASQAPNPDEPS